MILTEYDPKSGVSVATLAYDYPSGHRVVEHAHGSDQLIYAVSGLMEVSSGQRMWLIPPQFALWIPARTHHSIRMHGAVSMRTLYLRDGLTLRKGPRVAVIYVTPLLRELIVETMRVGRLRSRSGYESAMSEVLVAQIRRASPVPTSLTLPREARALAVAMAAIEEGGGSMSMHALCARAGVSVRTIERAFRREVGMTFSAWRQQARLTRAIELLVSGCAVKEVAYRIGYAQPNAIVNLFRKTLGATPKAWVSSLSIRPKRS